MTIRVFLSYSHKDETFKEKLVNQLIILKRQSVIDTWDDRKISPGEEWHNKISSELDHADIILLLVSSDFLASDYCWEVEIRRAIERHNLGEACVIPIILRPTDNWEKAPFGHIQALPKNAKPINKWGNRDEAFAIVAEGIRKAIQPIQERKQYQAKLNTYSQTVHRAFNSLDSSSNEFRVFLETYQQELGINDEDAEQINNAVREQLFAQSRTNQNQRGHYYNASSNSQPDIPFYDAISKNVISKAGVVGLIVFLSLAVMSFLNSQVQINSASQKMLERARTSSIPKSSVTQASESTIKISMLFDQARAKEAKGDNEGALEDYTQIIKLKPTSPAIYNNRGLARFSLGDNRGAILDFNNSLKLKNPEPWLVYMHRGLAHSRLGNNQAALADYDKAIKLKPNYADSYYNRAAQYINLKDRIKATADFQKAANLYKQQGNSTWYQNTLNRLKELE